MQSLVASCVIPVQTMPFQILPRHTASLAWVHILWLMRIQDDSLAKWVCWTSRLLEAFSFAFLSSWISWHFFCYQLLIEDFSLQNGKMVLTLCRPHRVLRWQTNEPFVTLSSTGTPPLENLPKGCSFQAKVLTGRDLHLIHPEGKVEPWDTSIGFCRVGFLSALLHTGYFTASFYLLVVALVCCRGGLCEAASWADDHHLPFVGSGQHPAASALVSLDDALQPFSLEAGPIPSREPRKSRTWKSWQWAAASRINATSFGSIHFFSVLH